MITSGGNIGDGIKSVVSTFSVGGVLGAIIGLIWLPIMHKIRKMQFSYISTLAIVFLLYSFTEALWTGSGVLACLIFGLVLGNGKKVLRIIKYEGKTFEMDQETKNYHSLISFVIRTFFFVFLGIIVSYNDVDLAFILIGIIILIAILMLRYLAVQITTYKGGFEKDDKQTINVMLPRGLAAAILAIRYGPEIIETYRPELLNPDVLSGFFEGIAFVVILGTAIITTVGVSIICHYEMKKIKNTEKSS
jgi:cell volume regulation protein A